MNCTIEDVKRYIEDMRAFEKINNEVCEVSRCGIDLNEVCRDLVGDNNYIAERLFGEDLFDTIQWRLYDDGKGISFDCDTDKQRDYVLESDEDFYEMVKKEYLSGEKK